MDTLLALTAEWGRVLAPWGSIAIELGDTYAKSSARRGDRGWPRAKCPTTAEYPEDPATGTVTEHADAIRGINRQPPYMGSGRGLYSTRFQHGIKRQLPHLGSSGVGVNRQTFVTQDVELSEGIRNYLRLLSARLRPVRVCNGDWSRVVTTGATDFGKTIGVFLDPPYLGEQRTKDLYATDNHNIAREVRKWAIINGDKPHMRIVLAGYAPEHDHLVPDNWQRIRWSGTKAYGNSSGGGDNERNRHKEMLWLSPNCLPVSE